MLVPLPWLCSSSSSAEENTSAASGSRHITSINPATTGSSSSSLSSVITHPSLPSLHSVIPPLNPSPLFSASFLCLSSITSPSSDTTSPALAASASSLLLYTATESSLSVYDLSDLRTIDRLPAPPGAGAAKSISLSPDGNTIFTAHQDGRIRVWNRSPRSGLHRLSTSLPTTADRLRRFPLPKNYVTIRRHHKRLWISHADAVSGIAAGNSGLLYSVSWDKTLKIWSSFGLRCLESILAHEDAVNAVVAAGDGTVYTGSADRRIRVWARAGEGKKHELVATLDRHRSAVNALAISGDGSVLYSGACDRSVLVWEREEKAGCCVKATGALRGHERAILSLACAEEVVVSGDGDGVVRVWRREGMRAVYSCVAVMAGHARGVRSVVVVRMVVKDGNGGEEEYRVCSGSLDGEVRVWRVCVTVCSL